MTPAFVQSKISKMLVSNYGSTYITGQPGSTRRVVADVAAALPGGWQAAVRRGTEPPPLGGVLVGAVKHADPGECDDNLYIHPVTPEAMVLRETV